MGAKGSITVADLGALVRRRRETEKLGIRRAADLCGVPRSTLSRIERGIGEPSLEAVERLGKWVGVPLNRILLVRSARRPDRVFRRTGADLLRHIAIHLRADPNLDSRAAELVIGILTSAYSHFTRRRSGR